jgi:hypothetical protein
MTRNHRFAVLMTVAILGIASIAARVSAQYRPPPPVPLPEPEPTPTPVPPPEEAAESQPPAPAPLGREQRIGAWDILVVADVAREQNVGFVAPEGPDDAFGSLGLSLTRLHRASRGDWRIGARGTGYLYHDQKNWNRADGGVDLQAKSRLSRWVTGRLTGSYDYGHSDSSGALIGSGVLLPLVPTQTGLANAGLTWGVGRRTSVTLDGRWSGFFFDSSTLLDTQTWSGGVGLSQQLSLRDALGVGADFARTRETGALEGPLVWDYLSLTLGYSHTFLPRRVVFDVRAGPGRSHELVGPPGSDGSLGWGLDAAAGLSGRIRGATLTARYQHSQRPSVGLGRNEQIDSVSLGWTIPIGRAIEFILNGVVSRRRDPTMGDAPSSKDADLYVGASARMARCLRLVFGYRLRYRDWVETGKAQNDRAGVSLVWASNPAR